MKEVNKLLSHSSHSYFWSFLLTYVLFRSLPYKGEKKMSSTVLHEFYRKKAAFFHGLSWGVSHIAVSWGGLGLPHSPAA